MTKIVLIVLFSLFFLPVNYLFACSNIFIYGNGYAAVARTSDTSINEGGIFGVGFVGESNTTRINPYSPKKSQKLAKWKNKYGYMGYTWRGSHILIDGVNSAGVYVGCLYLGDSTKYPSFNSKDPRPCLAVLDTMNYILATSNNVSKALKNLQKNQIVKSLVPVNPLSKDGKYFLSPFHIIIRDKSGNSAAIEWIDGKTVIYKNPGNVLTNDPVLSLQLRNAEQYDHAEVRLIPVDWSPVSRFVRAYQLVKHSPAPKSENEALRTAMSILQSVQAPYIHGVNDDPTIWESLIDLKNSIYYFLPIIDFSNNGKKVLSFNPATSWKTFDLKKILKEKRIPKGFVSTTINPDSTDKVKSITKLNTLGKVP